VEDLEHASLAWRAIFSCAAPRQVFTNGAVDSSPGIQRVPRPELPSNRAMAGATATSTHLLVITRRSPGNRSGLLVMAVQMVKMASSPCR
jgi:hypothetical protein